MLMVSFWTVASPPHELNPDVLGTSLALHSHIYDRQELFSVVFWDSKESRQRRSFRVLCVHVAIPISLS